MLLFLRVARVATVAGTHALSMTYAVAGAMAGFTLGLGRTLHFWRPARHKMSVKTQWPEAVDPLDGMTGALSVVKQLSGLMVKVLSALGGVLRLDVSVVALSGTFQYFQRTNCPPPLRRRMLQLVVLGDSGVGKTRMVQQYVYGDSSFQTCPTYGADFHMKDILWNDTLVTLQIWDVSGQDGFALGPHFFHGVDGCLLVHNSCSTSSLENLQAWLRAFESLSGAKHEEGFPAAVLLTEHGRGNNGFYQEKIKGVRSLAWEGSTRILPVYQMMSPIDNQAAFDAFMYITQEALQRSAKINYYGGDGIVPFQIEDGVWAGLGE